MGFQWSEGIHYGLSFDEYVAIDAMNVSTLKWAGVSPAHLKAAIDGKFSSSKTDSRSVVFGQALHAAVLEPDEFYDKFTVSKPCQAIVRSGAKKGQPCGQNGVCVYKGEWLCGRHASKTAVEWFKEVSTTLLTEDEATRIREAIDTLKQHPALKLVRQRGGYEATVCFELEGVRCKGRIDKEIPRQGDQPPIIVDLKTIRVGGAVDDSLSRAIYQYQYDVQAAWYVDAIAKIRGESPIFIWVFIESDYPYGIRVLQCNQQTLQVGRMRYREYLGLYLNCMKTGRWPSYGDGSTKIEQGGLPQWVLDRYLGR